ncbi:hypothetical protein L1887_47188 [Cichorium endivia]|nr:hypothetical protein L1887_47188 [Cichorium endivia]
MSDLRIHAALSPRVAVLSSPDVDRVIQFNGIPDLSTLLRAVRVLGGAAFGAHLAARDARVRSLPAPLRSVLDIQRSGCACGQSGPVRGVAAIGSGSVGRRAARPGQPADRHQHQEVGCSSTQAERSWAAARGRIGECVRRARRKGSCRESLGRNAGQAAARLAGRDNAVVRCRPATGVQPKTRLQARNIRPPCRGASGGVVRIAGSDERLCQAVRSHLAGVAVPRPALHQHGRAQIKKTYGLHCCLLAINSAPEERPRCARGAGCALVALLADLADFSPNPMSPPVWVARATRAAVALRRPGAWRLPAGNDAQNEWYPYTSIEAQTRRLADFAFTIRDYKLAASMYDLGRKDFAGDKAHRHSAAATEMFGLSHLMIIARDGREQRPARHAAVLRGLPDAGLPSTGSGGAAAHVATLGRGAGAAVARAGGAGVFAAKAACGAAQVRTASRHGRAQAYNDGDSDTALAHLVRLVRPSANSSAEHDAFLKAVQTAYKYSGRAGEQPHSEPGAAATALALPVPMFDAASGVAALCARVERLGDVGGGRGGVGAAGGATGGEWHDTAEPDDFQRFGDGGSGADGAGRLRASTDQRCDASEQGGQGAARGQRSLPAGGCDRTRAAAGEKGAAAECDQGAACGGGVWARAELGGVGAMRRAPRSPHASCTPPATCCSVSWCGSRWCSRTRAARRSRTCVRCATNRNWRPSTPMASAQRKRRW